MWSFSPPGLSVGRAKTIMDLVFNLIYKTETFLGFVNYSGYMEHEFECLNGDDDAFF